MKLEDRIQDWCAGRLTFGQCACSLLRIRYVITFSDSPVPGYSNIHLWEYSSDRFLIDLPRRCIFIQINLKRWYRGSGPVCLFGIEAYSVVTSGLMLECMTKSLQKCGMIKVCTFPPMPNSYQPVTNHQTRTTENATY